MSAMTDEYLRSIDKQLTLMTSALESLQRSEERCERDDYERSLAINNFISLYVRVDPPHRKHWLSLVEAPAFLRTACARHDEYQESLGTGQSA